MPTDPYAGWLNELTGTGYNFNPTPNAGEGQTYDAFGNVVSSGSAAASSADPTGLAQAQLDLNAANAGGSTLGSFIKDLLGGTGGLGSLGQLGAFAALAALANQSKFFNPPPVKVGYQGGIPSLTAYRQQTPLAQQRPEGYRPGQGGITYFNPIQYLKPGEAPVQPSVETPTQPDQTISAAQGGGISELARGRFLKGPGDGVSDSIDAKFVTSGQPAKLADGEFVLPARVVSELGNGSSEAGARKLYAMMDRVEQAAKKAKRGKDSKADKHLPA